MKNKILHKIFGILLVMMLFCGLSISALAEDVYEEVSTLSALNTQLNAGNDVKLTADIEGDVVINTAGVNVTIDLNGYDIQGSGESCVIFVGRATNVTLKDSSGSTRERYGYWDTDGTYSTTDNASGLSVYDTLIGGIVYNGTGYEFTSTSSVTDIAGGGVFIQEGNSSYSSVNGVGGVFTLAGGTIAGNTAEYGGGVAVFHTADTLNTESKFYMTGGTIVGNTATHQGGGVYGGAATTLKITGGTISNNRATTSGGGIYLSSMARLIVTQTRLLPM